VADKDKGNMKEFEKQISFFDGSKEFKIPKDMPIRLIELFAGIGAQCAALSRLADEGLCNFKGAYKICEFDKYAVKSYNAIHGTDFQTSDITELHGADLGIEDTDKYMYIMTYSFPCTDLSLAGKQEGMAKGSGTRSGLLWEVERLLNEVDELPQVLLMENVPQVICDDFFEWCRFLESKGYKNYYKLMNAKNYGIPQNRNRCFMVSLLGDYLYEFPAPFPLEKRLKDVLEDKVDEKYYLKDKALKFVMKRVGGYTQLVNQDSSEIHCPLTSSGNQNWTGNFVDEGVPIKTATKDGYEYAYDGDSINLSFPDSQTRRGRVGKQVAQTLETGCNQGIIVRGNYSPSGHDASRIVDTEGIAPTVKENHGTVTAITEDVAKTIRGGGERLIRPTQLGYSCGGIFSNKGTELEDVTDVATTLMARDYKGFGNQTMTGVIEVQNEK